MKLLQYPNDCHPKNRESMERMCKAWGIDFEATNDRSKCNSSDVTILWLPMFWISPDEFPGKYILYGPHHFVFPEGPIIGPRNEEWSKRCAYTALSDWNVEVFKEFAPETVIPIVPLSFGINPEIEDCKSYPKTLDCVVYVKRRNPEHVQHCIQTLQSLGMSYKIFSYGSYKHQDYMDSLKVSKFCIWLGTHESQGFAFQECLASNVPILCWDATTMYEELKSDGTVEYERLRGQKQLKSTTATCWSSVCGNRISVQNELLPAIQNMISKYSTYTPREYILSKLTDYVIMYKILCVMNVI